MRKCLHLLKENQNKEFFFSLVYVQHQLYSNIVIYALKSILENMAIEVAILVIFQYQTNN